ncbi:hypothetical protein EJ07DRAFT_93694 [Lizonia empirigonia]|nr:hypothetical protein EJ07DRAFT_93694 [Lizonia empirigonia]
MTATLAKRLRARAICLPCTHTQHGVFSKPFNIGAAKQRAADWEPSLNFDGLETDSKRDNDDDNTAHMVTYSPFNPGATSTLLLSSALPVSSSLHHAVEVQQTEPVGSGEKVRPWPYSLPKCLQPQAGTTFDLTNGDGDAAVGKLEVGVLETMLYGVPEPGEVGGRSVGCGLREDDGKAGC